MVIWGVSTHRSLQAIQMSHTIRIIGQSQRDFAKRVIDSAPVGWIVRILEPKRTDEQNDKMWAMLTDLSVAKPEGRTATPDTWKALVMHACGHDVQFEIGLNGQPFPVGFRSSKLTKAQMSDLIEWIYQYGAEHGVKWSDERESA